MPQVSRAHNSDSIQAKQPFTIIIPIHFLRNPRSILELLFLNCAKQSSGNRWAFVPQRMQIGFDVFSPSTWLSHDHRLRSVLFRHLASETENVRQNETMNICNAIKAITRRDVRL